MFCPSLGLGCPHEPWLLCSWLGLGQSQAAGLCPATPRESPPAPSLWGHPGPRCALTVLHPKWGGVSPCISPGVQAVGRHLEISSAWAAAVHPAYIWFQSWFLCCCYICHRAFNNVSSDIIYKNWVKWVCNSGHLLKKTWGKLSGKLLWIVKSLLLLCLFVFTRSNTNLLFSQSHLMEEISLWCFITP